MGEPARPEAGLPDVSADARKPGRLTRRPEFLAVAAGRRFHTARLTVQSRGRDDALGLRVGFTVTKRVGHATERNRIRRRLRAAALRAVASGAAALDAGRAHADIPVDLVVVARRDALAAPFDLLVADLAKALEAAGRRGADPRPSRNRRERPTPKDPAPMNEDGR